MNNTYKSSLLIITATIICVATTLFGSKVFAQSELLFTVNREISFAAPSVQNVFDGYEYNTTDVTRSEDFKETAKETEVKNAVITTNVDVYEKPSDDITIASKLHFPIQKKVSFQAPSMDEVFFTNQEYSTTVIDPVTNEEMTEAELRILIAKQIADIESQITTLRQRITALKEKTAGEFGYGDCGSYVKNLQRFLNRNDFTVAITGPGSMGQETSFFGPLTLAALRSFQSTYGIPVSGVVDTSTNILIDSIEHGALSEMTAESCVTQKPIREDTIPKAKNNKNESSQDDTENKSKNFLTDLIQMIIEFFQNLFSKVFPSETEQNDVTTR